MNTELSSPLRARVAVLLACDPSALLDPYPLFQQLRDDAAVFVYDAKTVIVSQHALVKAILSDSTRFPSSEDVDYGFEGRYDLLSAEEVALYREWMEFERTRVSRMNGESHRRVRSAAHRFFTPRELTNRRHAIQRLVTQLLDQLEQEQDPDFMNFAYRLPLLVILDIMGAPYGDGPLLRKWCDAIVHPAGQHPLQPEAVKAAHAAEIEFREYVRELVEAQRRVADRPTLVSALLDASEDDRLSQPELVSMYLVLLLAGHETTTNMFGTGFLALLRSRSQWDLLRGDPSLVSTAVEEFLRYEAPVQFIRRLTTDQQKLAGVTIPDGATILAAIAAANRDPLVFEAPDEFDIRRRPNEHLSFGYGPHFCLGAGLTRMEGEVALSEILRRYPNLELAVDPADVTYQSHFELRRLVALPVNLSTAQSAIVRT